MKEFNTTGVCIPSKHYMVDLTERVAEIEKLVDAGKYFTIHRARQYGKTTTIHALGRALAGRYVVLSLDFQGIDRDVFESGASFSQAFARLILDLQEFGNVSIPETVQNALREITDTPAGTFKMDHLFRVFKRWIRSSTQPVVLMIDEVDATADNLVFLDFLAQLRDAYISRDTNGAPAFQSVILAGVTDIRHLKNRIREDDLHRVNSPWNIAADFTIDMSLSRHGIQGMLDDYEADHHTGMDTAVIAKSIRDYTGGYPFLVSRICELIDKDVSRSMGLLASWTLRGVEEAVKKILSEKNTLFQSVTGKLHNYPALEASVRSILMEGVTLSYNALSEPMEQLEMYGLIHNDRGTVRISNRLFETLLYNRFLSEEELKNSVFSKESALAKNIFVEGGTLNMRLVLERFIETYLQVFGPLQDRFTEKDGRELFLLYLKPIINGTGNFYIEAQTRDMTRTDVIVDYLGRQFIIELKIWHGERYNAAGEKQILEYLDYWNLDTGYMLSFNFNKKKKTGVERIQIGGKTLFEGVV